jgi:hypothetical protein
MREEGSLIQETGCIRNPDIIDMWDISDHLAAIGVTSAIAECAVARSAHLRSTTPRATHNNCVPYFSLVFQR